MKEIFKVLISDFLEHELPDLIDRDINIPINSKKIITLIGGRRVGKTYLFYSIISNLRKTLENERIIYINFEDDRLFPLGLKNLDSLLEGYFELFPGNRKKTVYFFFDEIQIVSNWEKFIRRTYDSVNCRIFITGSSSKFLSREIATALRGRTISLEVFPFSFLEFLRFKGIKGNYYSSANKSKIVNASNQYFSGSSYPEILEALDIEKPRILKEYLDMVIYKDLIERYNITNLYLIKYLMKFLISNSANPISVSKIFNDFKSQGIKVSKNSLYQYIEYLQDAHVMYPVKIFSDNMREIHRNPQKMYCIDTGLIDIVSLKKNIGRRFENIVFIELRRRFSDISYLKGRQEVDFCINDEGSLSLINASYSLDNKITKEREINSLIEGMNLLNIDRADLITNSHEELFLKDKKTINIIPFWKWILEDRG